MNSFYLCIQSRSVDKQHAVISVNLENAEYKLHDLGTLNGVSMSTPWNAIEDPIKLEVLESCVLSYSLPCAILLLKPQIGIKMHRAPRQLLCVAVCHQNITITTPCSPLPPPHLQILPECKERWFPACHSGRLLLVQPICTSPIVFNVAPQKF